jgi:hypothetical protein
MRSNIEGHIHFKRHTLDMCAFRLEQDNPIRK